MFGQQPKTNTFGAGPSSTFTSFSSNQGAFAKPGFSNNAFGQQNSIFSSTPTGLFGASPSISSTATSFGGFGNQPQQQQQTSIFGSTNVTGTAPSSFFGSQQTSSTFGSAKPTGYGFGQQSTGVSLFGQNQQQSQPGLFGAQTGQQTPGTGLFNNSQMGAQNTNIFGQTPQMSNQMQNGTAIVKFQPQQETDTLLKGSTTSYVQTKQQCITFMKEYADKSLEELRIEDYMANRKGPQAGSSSGGLFASNQTSSVFNQPSTNTLFGQTPQQGTTNLFGAGNTSAVNNLGSSSTTFGNTSTFGNPTSNLFGKPLTTSNVQATSSFGSFGSNTSTFGISKPFSANTPTTVTPFGGMNNTAGSTFGSTFANNNATSQPLFGATSTASAFATNTNFSGLQSTNNNLFGSNQKNIFGTANTFGTSQAQPLAASTGFPTFGQSAANSSGNTLFTQKPTFSFSNPTASTFGGANTGSSLFGTSTVQPNTNSLFGSTGNTSSVGLFNTSSPFNAGGTLPFNTSQSQQTLFNSQPSNSVNPLIGQESGFEIHNKIIALTSNPYGENELYRGIKQSAISDDALKVTNPVAQKILLDSNNSFKISPSSVSKVKIKPVNTAITKKSLFDGLEEYDASLDESFVIKSNTKRLIIKPRLNNSINSSKTLTEDSVFNKSATDKTFSMIESNTKSVEKENDQSELLKNQLNLIQAAEKDVGDADRRVSWLRTTSTMQSNRMRSNTREANTDTTINQFAQNQTLQNPEADSSKNIKMRKSINTSLDETFNSNDDNPNDTANISIYPDDDVAEKHPSGITLRRAGYYTIPSLDELVNYIDSNGRCIVPNFTIGRKGYGNVYFDEELDITGLNLDEICHFRYKEIILYQDDDNKPPVGEGLNRKAQVTLDQIWPHDKTTHEPIKDINRLEALGYEAKLRRICEKRNAKFLEYRPESGSCVFKVDHFSKYTLSDSDDDDTLEHTTDTKKAKLLPHLQKRQENNVALEKVTKSPSDLRVKQAFADNNVSQQGYFEKTSINLEENGAQYPISPSIILANEMKMDTHKIQLMKASFFVEDDCDTYSSVSDMTDGRESPDQIVPPSVIIGKKISSVAKEMRISPFNNIQMIDNQERTGATHFKNMSYSAAQIFKSACPKSQALVLRPKTVLTDLNDFYPVIKNSILKGTHREEKYYNSTFFNGRKFKIGFGHENNIAVLHNQNLAIFQECSEENSTKLHPSVFQVKSMYHATGENFEKSVVDHLKIELKYSKLSDENSTEKLLSEHYEAAKNLCNNFNSIYSFDLTVWSLIYSLWGSFNYDDDINPRNHQDHSVVMIRRNFLSMWLENVVTKCEDLKSNSSYLDRLMNLLLCHKINEACELSLENNDMNMSLLISQANNGPSTKQLIQHQLQCWRETESDEFIDEKRLKILMMVSGVPNMNRTNNDYISLFETCNWLECLALQLWYISPSTASIADVLCIYERNFENQNSNVVPPLAPSKNLKKHYYDLRYHLLKLFCDRCHPLDVLCNPASYSNDLMDFRLAFFVLQALKSLGYTHVSESSKFKIYTGFAEQLELNGLWQWSIFVLFNLNDENVRENAIQKILLRHVRIDDELSTEYSMKEQFLLNELTIPEKWIYWAKAVRAKSQNKHQVELKYLLKAQQWTKAHIVMMDHIAPDLFINDNLDYLKSLLIQFKDIKDIQNWKVQGEILLNFIELRESFDLLGSTDDADEEIFLEQIRPKLSNLCSIIKLFPCPTSKHRLCQCEIAKHLAFIIRSFYANSTYSNQKSSVLMRTALEKLPLPQESSEQELKHILTTLLMENLTAS